MEKQIVEHTSQSSVELNKTAKGDHSWSIKIYGWDEGDCAEVAVDIDASLERQYGKQEEPKEKKDDLPA